MKISTPLVPNRSIALKHLQEPILWQIANYTNTGTTDGSGKPLNSTQPSLALLFDGPGNPCFVTTENENAIVVSSPTTTIRDEIININAAADDGTYAKGIWQQLNHVSGDANDANNLQVLLCAYCSDASAMAHNKNYYSIGIHNLVHGGGSYDWNVIKFIAPTAGVKHTIVYEFTAGAVPVWNVWVDGKPQAITQVVTPSAYLISAGDGMQIFQGGNVLENVSGSYARVANHAFQGTIGGFSSYRESGSGTLVATGNYKTPPAMATKIATTSPTWIGYLFSAADTPIYGGGNVPVWMPNRFGNYKIGGQHLRLGTNSVAGAAQANAPVFIYV